MLVSVRRRKKKNLQSPDMLFVKGKEKKQPPPQCFAVQIRAVYIRFLKVTLIVNAGCN